MSSKIDVIKAYAQPYLLYIKIGIAAAVMGACLWGGYRLGTAHNAGKLADTQVQVVSLAAENAALRQANAKNADAVAAANAIVAESQKKAEEATQQAMTYGQLVAKTNAELEKIKQTNIQKARIAAASEKCIEQMRMQVCDAVPQP